MSIFTTALEHDEILTEIRIPLPPARSGGAYFKLERKVGDFATAAVAAQVTLDAGGACMKAGIGLTNVGPDSHQSRKGRSSSCAGRSWTAQTIAQAAQLAADESQPSSDLRGPAEYKKGLVKELTKRRTRSSAPRKEPADRRSTMAKTHHIHIQLNGQDEGGRCRTEIAAGPLHPRRGRARPARTWAATPPVAARAPCCWMDGRSNPAPFFAVQADGREIRTVEGLTHDGKLHPIQEGFHQEHGLQCGFCTPGMMMSAWRCWRRIPNPTEEEIRWGISGNLCRCTGYQNIVKAVQYAAAKMQMQKGVAA